ncbi:hypothetical protein EH222_12630 [candidate division KSB1 bacterium]|nr:MAG: hypothetical protein EH222_12630 [candidate division KSB1 bacterium]
MTFYNYSNIVAPLNSCGIFVLHVPFQVYIYWIRRYILSHLNGRDHLAVSLLYGAGMRLGELLQLRIKDID